MISLTLGYISLGIYFYEYQERRNVDKNLTLIKYTYKIDANSNKPKAWGVYKQFSFDEIMLFTMLYLI